MCTMLQEKIAISFQKKKLIHVTTTIYTTDTSCYAIWKMVYDLPWCQKPIVSQILWTN